MPIIGFGTYKLRGIECQKAVEHALKSGYRHIDTAECYKNSRDIAKAIKCIGSTHKIQRKDLFITTKLSPRAMKSENKMESAIIDSLQSLNTQYIDLYLLHWPGVSGKKISDSKQSEHRLIAWNIMQKYVKKGLIRSIGVSNFEISHLKPLMNGYKNGRFQLKPSVNQFEFHPLYQRHDLMQYGTQNNIICEGYGSLGCGESHRNNIQKHPLLDNSIITRMAQKYKKSAAQILIRYGIQNNFIVIPKSSKLKRIEENLNVFDFEINAKDQALIDKIGQQIQTKFAWNPCNIK